MKSGKKEVAPLPLAWPHNLLLHSFMIDVRVFCQPDDISCGVCCLKMVLDYFGKEISFDALSLAKKPRPDIGLYDTHLGKTALALGYPATIYSYNYRIFHPFWNHLGTEELIATLKDSVASGVLHANAEEAAESYIEFLENGGNLFFYPLSKELILVHLDNDLPVIAGLDLAFLYDYSLECRAEFEDRATHFVVICGYEPKRNVFCIADPWHSIPLENKEGHYYVDADRVINAILLGQDKNDSALIVIEPSYGK